MEASSYHTPVLLQETLSFLLTTLDGIYVDCTVGGGGHAEAIMLALRGGRVIGFDRDREAIEAASMRLRRHGNSFEAVHATFDSVERVLSESGIERVHGVLMDLGVSSHHLNDPRRGFSFQQAGPLDMRMDIDGTMSARDVVNTSSEEELISILRNYGEEQRARRIAREIVRSRPMATTTELRTAVESAVTPPDRVKSLARVFQALRIKVNDELDQLHEALVSIPKLLVPGGRIVVISYHSLEDRTVKEFFRSHAMDEERGVSRFLPSRPKRPDLLVLTKRPVTPGEDELKRNARSRSAKLRAAERL